MGSARYLPGRIELRSCPSTGAVVIEQLNRLTATGPIAAIDLNGLEVVFINDPNLVREVLVKDAASYRKSRLLRKARRYVDGSQILSPARVESRGRHWMPPLLGPRVVAGYRSVTSELTDRLVVAWEPGPTDLMALICQLTTEITLATLFGWLPPQTRSQMAPHLFTVTSGVIESPLVDAETAFSPAVVGREQRRNSAQADLLNVLRQSLGGTFRHGAREVLGVTLASDSSEPGASLDAPGQVASELVVLAVSSTVTTTAAACWAVHLLYQNPICLTPIIGRDEAFARCFVKEALRLYPPLWLFARDAVRPIELGGQHFREETSVVFSPYILHRNPGIYESPTLFDPARWQSMRRRALGNGFFASFGMGARSCVGELAAWQELQIIVGSIARHWDMCAHPDSLVKPVGHMLLHPNRLDVTLIPREGRGDNACVPRPDPHARSAFPGVSESRVDQGRSTYLGLPCK